MLGRHLSSNIVEGVMQMKRIQRKRIGAKNERDGWGLNLFFSVLWLSDYHVNVIGQCLVTCHHATTHFLYRPPCSFNFLNYVIYFFFSPFCNILLYSLVTANRFSLAFCLCHFRIFSFKLGTNLKFDPQKNYQSIQTCTQPWIHLRPK